MEIIKNPNFDFIGKAKYFVALSIALILAGLAWIATGHLRYGVEFSGGTQLILHFQTTPDTDKIRDAVTRVSPGAVIQTYGDIKNNKVLVRISQEASESDLDGPARAVRQALADGYGQNAILESSSEIVGPIVGAELRQKAILLTVLGLLFQLIYIAARFKGGIWGVGATLAAFHDVLIALGVLAFFNFEITLNVIAAPTAARTRWRRSSTTRSTRP
jgi:preprotein translocase subunit SecF